MLALVTLFTGFILGLIIHMVTMKISFKQRTIDNKIKVYDSIITSWVKMRNTILSFDSSKWLALDRTYGESQAFIGEIFLISDNSELANDINNFNEKFYRKKWVELSSNDANSEFESLKTEAISLVNTMKSDIQSSTILRRSDIFEIFRGIFCN